MVAARAAALLRDRPCSLASSAAVSSAGRSGEFMAGCLYNVIPGWSEGPDPESRDSGFVLRTPRNDDVAWVDSCCDHSGLRPARQQPLLDRLDLKRQMFRADAALREAAGDEPEAGLAGARVHVAQFLAV